MDAVWKRVVENVVQSPSMGDGFRNNIPKHFAKPKQNIEEVSRSIMYIICTTHTHYVWIISSIASLLTSVWSRDQSQSNPSDITADWKAILSSINIFMLAEDDSAKNPNCITVYVYRAIFHSTQEPSFIYRLFVSTYFCLCMSITSVSRVPNLLYVCLPHLPASVRTKFVLRC